jgi:predicted HNH restriction endonuclease
VPKGYARSLLDVHHVEALASGERETTVEGLAVLRPLCHRRHHVRERAEELKASA